MKYKDFTTTTPKPSRQNQKPSHIYNNQFTNERAEARKDIRCSIQGCCNRVSRLSTVCYEHTKHMMYHGTYNPTPFKFRKHISKNIPLIKDFSSDNLIELEHEINRLFTNPYSYELQLLKGGFQNKTTTSKEKLSNFIKHSRPSMSSHTLALRLILVYKAFIDGNIEGGSQLRLNLAKALIPRTNQSPYMYINLKEVIGQTIISNFIVLINIILPELERHISYNQVQLTLITW